MRNLTLATVDLSSRHADNGHDEKHGERIEGANPIGTRFNDILIGVDDADTVIGLGGSDVLKGRGGGDVLIGVNAAGKNPGLNELDVLYGEDGANTFVLGDLNGGVFYLDKGKTGRGRTSYAGIQDFKDGDKISLRCYEMGEYELASVRVGNVVGTAIYYNKDSKPGIGKGDDLIAVVQGPGATSLDLMNNNQFNWII